MRKGRAPVLRLHLAVALLAGAALGALRVVQGGTGLFLWWPFTRRLERGFTIRRGRTWRVVGYDLHKRVGIASLAFNVPMAFTGALLAVSATAATEASSAPASEYRGSGLTLDQVARRAEAIWPGGSIASLRVRAGAVEVREHDGNVARIDRQTGAVAVVSDSRRPGDRLWSAVAPLHEGRFGGAASRWLYVAGGLTPAALALTGFGIWLTRPRPRVLARTRHSILGPGQRGDRARRARLRGASPCPRTSTRSGWW